LKRDIPPATKDVMEVVVGIGIDLHHEEEEEEEGWGWQISPLTKRQPYHHIIITRRLHEGLKSLLPTTNLDRSPAASSPLGLSSSPS